MSSSRHQRYTDAIRRAASSRVDVDPEGFPGLLEIANAIEALAAAVERLADRMPEARETD